MKKLVAIMTALSLFSYAAAAETVIVVDTNGNVLQKTVTSGGTLIPNQIVTTETYRSVPQVNTTIIRETPVYNETYTYSNVSAGTAILAGITTGIIGGLVYHDLKHHHKKAPVINVFPSHHHHKSAPSGHHHSKPSSGKHHR